jgi:PPK2 family polyphosphate:nucleotide phosphotransferase
MNTFEKCLVEPGTKIDLNKIDPGETFCWTKGKAHDQTKKNLERIGQLQELLHFEGKRGLNIVLQAMDTGGKDGTVRTIGGAMNPAGTRVISFKQPTAEELAHDFLWRIEKVMPKAGEIVISNRSQYEDVAVVRVHNMVPEDVWRGRYGLINNFEEKLSQPSPAIPEGTHVLKFFLHISKDEQWRRFRDRIDNPAKQWKLSEADFKERAYWDDYMRAYSDAIANCTSEKAPWFVIPADNKWLRDLVISQIVADYLEGLHMQLPKPSVDIEAIRKKYFSDEAPAQKPAKSAPPIARGPFNSL